MKTKNWIIIVLAILIVSTGFATEIPNMNVSTTKSMETRISFESDKAWPIELTIMSDDDAILYYWKSETPKEKHNQVFDFSNVKYGKYKVCLNYGDRGMYSELSVTREGVFPGPVVQLHSPFFSYSDDKLKLSFLNSGKENVDLKIYQDGDFVAGARLGKKLDIRKIIDFSHLEKGDYDVVLSDNFSTHHFVVHKYK